MLTLKTKGVTKFVLTDARTGEVIGNIMFNGVSSQKDFITVFDIPDYIDVERTWNYDKINGSSGL